MERIKTDILILGSGGAGLFAALHARRAAPDADITIAVKGLLGKLRLHAHGAGRLQTWRLPRKTPPSGTSWTPSKAASGSTGRISPGRW